MPTASDNRNPWSTRKEGGCSAFLPDFHIPQKRVEKKGIRGCSEWAGDNEADLCDAPGQRDYAEKIHIFRLFLCIKCSLKKFHSGESWISELNFKFKNFRKLYKTINVLQVKIKINEYIEFGRVTKIHISVNILLYLHLFF